MYQREDEISIHDIEADNPETAAEIKELYRKYKCAKRSESEAVVKKREASDNLLIQVKEVAGTGSIVLPSGRISYVRGFERTS